MADDKDDFSTEYDDLDLDLDIMGDEGDLMDDGGSRRPSAVTKEFFSGALSGLGQGKLLQMNLHANFLSHLR